MELNLLVRVECRDPGQRDLFVRFLAEQTRPILEDEVPPEERPTYLALEHTDYPEWLEPLGETALRVSWWFGGWDYDEDVRATLNDLLAAGAVDLVACVWFEGGEGSFIRSDGKGLKRVRWADKLLDELDADDSAGAFALLDRVRDEEGAV